MPTRSDPKRGQKRKRFSLEMWDHWIESRKPTSQNYVLRSGIEEFRYLLSQRGQDTHEQTNETRDIGIARAGSRGCGAGQRIAISPRDDIGSKDIIE